MQSGLRAVMPGCAEEAHQEWFRRLGPPEEETVDGVVREVTLLSVVSIGKKVTHPDWLLQ